MASTSQNQSQYLYKIGDYVYFETSATQPYQIRRIEELQKLPNNQVEAKVTCFFRRRDLASQLLQLADKHTYLSCIDSSGAATPESAGAKPGDSAGGDEQSGAAQNGTSTTSSGENALTSKQRHQQKHRELFMSRQVETLSATLIRGKCSVMLLNETESPSSYLQRGDGFYYRLVYDPDKKTLLADRGEIRVGPKYQVTSSQLGELLTSRSEDLKATDKKYETPLWINDPMDDQQIERFVTITKSVGAFARALDLQSAAKHSSLQLSAATASRDITTQMAHNILHEAGYKIADALNKLLPSTGPLLCRDEMECWTAHEVQLFQNGLEKCGKNFSFIRSTYLPWKSMRSIVEYYYFLKTTDRYVHQRRAKAADAARKLTAFYVAPFNKPSPALLPAAHALNSNNPKPCESCCLLNSPQWYAFGTTQQTRICASCWSYWKRYGGLKLPTRLDGERPTPRGRQERVAELQSTGKTGTAAAGTASPTNQPLIGAQTSPGRSSKQRGAAALTDRNADSEAAASRGFSSLRGSFCMQVTHLGRLARIVCDEVVRTRKIARAPVRTTVAAAAVKQAIAAHLDALTEADRSNLLDAARNRQKDRHERAALAVREMMRSHPYFRAASASTDSPDAPTKTTSIDSATKRCTRSPVKCAQSASANGVTPMDTEDGASSQPSAITISRRSANKLSAHAPGVGAKVGVANGGDNDSGVNRAAGMYVKVDANDDLRVGVSTTGITRKRMRDSLTSPNESLSPGCNRSREAEREPEVGGKRSRSDLQILVNKTDRGVNLRVVAAQDAAIGNDLSAEMVLGKYRECIDLVNEHERVLWEPSWYMLAMPLVRRARSKCVSAQQLRRLGRKWTQNAFELPAAAKTSTVDTHHDAAKQSDAKWAANESASARTAVLDD